MGNSNWIGNVALGITISKENITNDLKNAFKNLQQEADQHNITYKIAGDKSSLESTLKQLQGMNPELLTKINFNFDKSDYDREMNLLKNASGKTADQIGKDFKTSITSSLKGFSINEIIGKNLGKKDALNVKDVGKLKDALQGLMNQTSNFDLSKATSVGEINNQVVALSKMKVILESLSKHSDQKSIKIDGKSLNIAEMLQNNTSQIDSIMSNVGNVIKTNASQWAVSLESTFNQEYNNIISLLESIEKIKEAFKPSGDGSGGMFGQMSGDMKNLQAEIDKTTQEIEELESKLTELQNKKNSFGKSNVTSKKNELIKYYESYDAELKYEKDYDKKGTHVSKFKSLINEYMQLGGLIDNLTPKVKSLAESLKIKQIVPQDVNKEIETLTNSLEAAKNKKQELEAKLNTQQQHGGQPSGGQGTPTNANVSPILSPTFKEDLQKLVDATGSVNATVSGKLSETFLGDLQTNADGLGTVKVGVDFGKKEGTQPQEIPVDVITTPKLSETFQGDLQKLIDGTGKYQIAVGASENQQTDLIPIKASVENGEEFRDQLKQAIEGTDGLDVKVKPVIADDFNLEIKNAVLKDVKVEGEIQGGNLKPASIDTSTSAQSPTVETPVVESTAPIEAVKENLKDVKQVHEEVGKAAKTSAEVQKRSLLEVVKEIQRVNAEQEKLMQLENASNSNNEINKFVANKKQQAQEYVNIQELIAKIQSKISESTSKSATNTDKIKHLAGIVAYVERLKVLMGNKFSYDVLGENGEEKFNRMKEVIDNVSGSISDINTKVRELNQQLHSLNAEKSALEKTATDAEKLEVKLFNLAKNLENLKTTNKKGDLINISSKSFNEFFEKWKEYKTTGGTKNISDFTNEVKVINSVNKAYNSYIENIKIAKAEAEKKAATEAKALQAQVNGIKQQLTTKFPSIDLSQYTAVFDEVLNKKKSYQDAFVEIRDSILSMQEAANSVKSSMANAPTSTFSDTNVGTTGMAYETGEAEALRKKIVEVTTAVDNKTNAFRQEEQVVNGTVQSEITMLEVLDGQLNIILQDIQRIIDKPLKVNVDYSSIEQLSQADENGKSSIDKLKASINGLQTEVLKDLGESFKTLKINENTASRITGLSTALETLKETLSNIDPNSTGFLNTIKDLAKEANGLKDLATVIRASKEEIQKVQTTIAQQKSGSSVSTFNVAIGTEEWDVAIKRAEKYKDVIGEIKKITYNFRKDSDGKYYKSFSFTGTKGKAVEGKNGELLYGNENKDLNVATNKTAQQMDNLITKFEEAAKKAKLVYDVGSLKINDNGVITFTTTVEELGKEAVITKYKIEDLSKALNKDGSLSKNYLNSHSEGKSVKDLTSEYTVNDKEVLITATQQAIEWEERENAYLKERNKLLAEGKTQEKAYYDASNKERENYTKFWENSLLKQDQKSLDNRKEDLSASYSQADENVKRENKYLEERNRLLKEGEAQSKAYYDTQNKERESYIKFWEKSLLKQDQKSLDGRKEDLSTVYSNADENVKRENEYLEKRNQLLVEGKAQEKAYYDAVNKERENYIKFWEKALLKQDQESLKIRGVDTEALNTALQKTKTSMDQIFEKKQNIPGFQSVFDRAQAEVDELNKKLKAGQISNFQTGYTDKINKIIAGLNNVIGVTNPFDTASATEAMKAYANTINNGNIKVGNFTNSNKVLNVSFEEQKGVLREVALVYNEVSGAISYVDKGTKKVKSALTSFMDGIKARFKSLIQYLTIFVSYYRIIGMIKEGVQVVRDLDTALTEMRKVSDESVESLRKFQDASFDIAKSVGTTAKQIQESTADFMRLGESLEEAAKSAEVANILLNVSEFEGVDEATESLVAMSAAYDDLGKIDIVDKLNEVGNNFAISTDGLATALQSSASALKTAKNDIDESIALATAANAVVQDPDKVGAGLRTVALRITGTEAAKEELEELGEDVEDFTVTTVSKLNEKVRNLTKVAGKDGISLLDDNGNYRSTYEILQDIADVWEQIAKEDLTTGQNRQNALLEMLAGKNRSNILASILQNPETLREAYESSAFESEGSAQQELDKYLESIEGKIALFTNEVQEFWYGLIDSKTVKTFVDAGTKIIDILGNVTDKLGILGTVATSVGAAFAINFVNVKSGGRAKEVCPQSNQNMPPNRLTVRCASSGVHWSDNICVYNNICMYMLLVQCTQVLWLEYVRLKKNKDDYS